VHGDIHINDIDDGVQTMTFTSYSTHLLAFELKIGTHYRLFERDDRSHQFWLFSLLVFELEARTGRTDRQQTAGSRRAKPVLPPIRTASCTHNNNRNSDNLPKIHSDLLNWGKHFQHGSTASRLSPAT